MRANICYWALSRGFGANLGYVSGVIIWIGWTIGIAVATPETAGLYGVSVLFLILISDSVSFFLRQLVVTESIIVSVERAFILADLKSEKELTNDYDK